MSWKRIAHNGWSPAASRAAAPDVFRRALPRRALAALLVMLAPAPCLAQGLLNLNLGLGQDPLTVSTLADLDALLPDNFILDDLPLSDITITLNIDLPSGFPLTSSTCSGVNLVSLGNQQYGISLTTSLNVEAALGCTLETLSALQSTVGTIVPLLHRQNNFLLSLDLGLNRQIDLLSPDNGTDGGIWEQPYSLGAPMGLSVASDPWSASRFGLGGPEDAGEPSTVSFATSLRQSRQAYAPPPYSLGASAHRPAPAKPKFDVWAEGYLAHFDDDAGGFGSDGHTGVLYVGADYLLAPQLLLGTLVQFDDTEQDFDQLSQKAGTTGWMAGPYATLRLPSNLYFQARAAWGRSDNEIRFAAGPEDSFDAERWLVRGTLLGQWRAGPWQLQPRASVGYIEEDQESYTTANNVLIPSQTVSLGQAKAGSQVAYRYRLGGGTVIEPSLLLEGIWNFHQDAGLISIDDLVTGEDVRARAEAGVMLYTFDGIALGASVSYDGIGSGDYEAIGGRARVRMPFN